MPPPKGTPNPLEGPGDYDVTSVVHSDTYPAIDPTKADFSGKAVLITGASRGLGRAIAISFAKAGASMIAVGARSDLSATVDEVKAAAQRVGKPEPKVLALELDVADPKNVDDAATKVKESFGRLDVVINNAGIFDASKILDTDPEAWWNIWRVNVMGPFNTTRSFLPLLSQSSIRTIVTFSSVGAHLVGPGLSAYQSSKLAVLRLSEFISAEYGDRGIVAYAIHPGNILTDMVAGVMTPELKKVFTETPELSADSLVYLTSERRDWLAGRYINVTWDLPELVEKKDEIVKGDKLKVRLIV
ncbi:NAD(P)-binding protein [Daldinia caldariorum]|uniref:NAD(P)-binding protein n=1 Tax=Daldinia caldariorum TaxID=326644 RepID=UPI0020075B33|nr:NAD(P)-binding protein [Daldinia caldariorum]KAI1467545.1 NAD(P)-binding protein [Daldinia caldariorum]